MQIEKLKARVITKSTIRKRTRFREGGDHSYQGILYSYTGAEFSIELCEDSIQRGYEEVKRLIIGIGQIIDHYSDSGNSALEEQYSQNLLKLEQIIEGIEVRDTVEISVDKSQFERNRTDVAGVGAEKFGHWKSEGFHPIKFTYDPCLWNKDCLLHAPFGYEPFDYGDGRRTVDPEVKDVRVICNK